MKKKLIVLLTMVSILANIGTVAFAGGTGGIAIPPEPIRDSIEIVEEM